MQDDGIVQKETHTYPVSCQFKVPQLCQIVQILDLLYPILHKVDIPQLFHIINVLDVLDFIKAEVEGGQAQ